MRSSKPVASAQLISLPSEHHLGSRDQAHHCEPMMIPMPKPELASEKALKSATL